MQQVRHGQEEVVAGVIALLNELDPYGLEPGSPDGAPYNEYELEAHPMAGLLLRNGSISENQIDAIWQDMFDEPLSAILGAAEAERFTAGLNTLAGPVHPAADVRRAGRKKDSNE